MSFNEKFIERHVGELCKEYDKIRGANVNIARISPDLIDGLKPVQRRALYIMFLKNQGKDFRKLASISGDTFGRIHPHAPTSIDDAIVGLAQEWHNSIPLVEGKGNFGCHDDQTEVLTQNGWKLFKDITKEDLLASVNPEDGTMIFEHPKEIFEYEYSGEMIRGKHSALDFKVTPNHNMLIRKYDPNKVQYNKFKFVKADQLPKHSGLMNSFVFNNSKSDTAVILKEYCGKPEKLIKMEIWVQFIAIFLANGQMKMKSNRGKSYKVLTINAGKNKLIKKYYSNILNDMGINYSLYDTHHFHITDDRIWDKLESYGLLGLDRKSIIVPSFIFKLDAKYINSFIEAFYIGTGRYISSNNKGIKFRTKSEKMAEQLQILMLMTGSFSTIYCNQSTKQGVDDKSSYVIYQWKGKGQCIDTNLNIYREHYEGKVYCAEVPTYHTLITRRNGKILLSGNSLSGDPAGASRYIYGALSEYARACFFDDWKYSVVDMTMGYDEETKEPIYLPAKYPNVLLNGCLGIGYGLASNIPCYNFKEVIDATILLMKDPNANIVLIPDSPTGCDIIETNFAEICNRGSGKFSMRCKYEIDDENNTIIIKALPYLVTVNTVREKIADIKVNGGLSELINMNDLSGSEVNLQLVIRDDVNPYKFMRKLIKTVPDLEKGYPVNINVVNNLEMFDYSIKQVLLEWIKWRREQKRTVITHKRSALLAEQRTNDVKIFIMNKQNLDETITIFRTSKNREAIEAKLIERYKHSEIRMDSLQAKTISMMRFHELSTDSYDECIKRRSELEEEINEVESLLNGENSVDKVIVAELRDGAKRFGYPRRSNVVPSKIKVSSEVEGYCILQLSSDGNIIRKPTSNIYEEAIPTDNNGYAVRVDNDSSFILVDEYGYYSFVKAKDIPIDTEVPINRYLKRPLDGKIIAMLPNDIENSKCCTLISRKGTIKRINISDMLPSKKPCMALDDEDRIVKGLVTETKTVKDILIYTKNGMGQRFDPNSIRITSPTAKGGNGFKLADDDEIIGCYKINPAENQYICYITMKGRVRLNLIEYLPTRTSKHDAMVKLIDLVNRDKLISIIGCNKLDKIQVFFNDGDSEVIEIHKLEESTMGSKPIKVTSKDAVQFNIVKAKLM